MPLYELAALGAATCWALSSLISAGPAGHLGAPAFNRLRQIFVAVLLGVYVGVTGNWQQLNAQNIAPILLSATSPVIILPLIWLRTGQRPARGAWGGALIVIVGMALIFTR